MSVVAAPPCSGTALRSRQPEISTGWPDQISDSFASKRGRTGIAAPGVSMTQGVRCTMLLDRRYALAGLLLVTAAGCGSPSSTAASKAASSPPAGSSAASPAPIHSTPTTRKPATSRPATSRPATSGPAGTPTPATISLPASLCSATDIAQNAADAYIGALSAGDAKQAAACVLPHTVPSAVTRSLLATAGATAVYLPRDGVDGPSVFGYSGNGKTVDVTVTKQRDGRFWVTKVVVRPA